MMQPHQIRVFDELGQLLERKYKLEKFVEDPHPEYAAIHPNEKTLLRTQISAMTVYANILTHRLCLWGCAAKVEELDRQMLDSVFGPEDAIHPSSISIDEEPPFGRA